MKNILCIFLLSGCCDIDFVTSQGIIFFLYDDVQLTEATANSVTDQFIDTYMQAATDLQQPEHTHDDISSALSVLYVKVYARKFKCSDGTYCGTGRYYEDMWGIFIAVDKTTSPPMTLCNSAYWHELAHHVRCTLDSVCGGGATTNGDPIVGLVDRQREGCVLP